MASLPLLPLNRLQCSDCKAFRSITDYHFRNNGFRAYTCRFCKTRRANKVQRRAQRAQERARKQEEHARKLAIYIEEKQKRQAIWDEQNRLQLEQIKAYNRRENEALAPWRSLGRLAPGWPLLPTRTQVTEWLADGRLAQTQLASQLTDGQPAQTELADRHTDGHVDSQLDAQNQFELEEELEEDWGPNDWLPIDERRLRDQLADDQLAYSQAVQGQLTDGQPTQGGLTDCKPTQFAAVEYQEVQFQSREDEEYKKEYIGGQKWEEEDEEDQEDQDDDDDDDSREEDEEEEAAPRYCSNCNQLRAGALFGQFKTCEICRNKGKKGKARREQIESHLQQWAAIAGEQELHNQGRAGFPSLIQTRPLTMGDYMSI
jgi:hypothetical protein